MSSSADPSQSAIASSNGTTGEKRNRRRSRLPLSCEECRKKKVLCDRNLPCRGCLKSGRPGLCAFEKEIVQPPLPSQLSQQNARHNSEDVQNLQAEVAQLKELLSKAYHQQNNGGIESYTAVTSPELVSDAHPGCVDSTNIYPSNLRKRSPPGYYSQHTLLKFFQEIPQLFSFVMETSDEWLKPLGVHLKKDKPILCDWRTNNQSQEEFLLESLLPPKDITDILVLFYTTHLGRVYHIIHLQTFKTEYAKFWIPQRPHSTAMTALILSIISISTCASVVFSGPSPIPSTYKTMAVQWIFACEEWIRRQSSKHRNIVHYQISCLIYLAKRMKSLKKKEFWKETGSLMQIAIMDGLHCDPSIESPYTGEMKRRIGVVLRELELQNSFEFGLPTLLHNLESNVVAPANLNDEDFDEASKTLPTSKPLSQFTSASYQLHSSRSWILRLEICRRLFSTGTAKMLSYDDVLRYTHDLTQEMHSLPPWNIDVADGDDNSKSLVLCYAFLHFQLTECVLAIHRPYLQREDNKYWLSENVCYQMSRETLLLNCKLGGLGIQSLTLVREDLLLASLNLTRIIMQQPKLSTSIIMTSSQSTVELLDQCLPFMEERYLSCVYGEPWCFLTLFASIMLIKTHLGKESWQTAKTSCAKRYLELYHQHQMSFPTQKLPGSQYPEAQIAQYTPAETDFSQSSWLNGGSPDIGTDPFDLEVGFQNIWETWGST